MKKIRISENELIDLIEKLVKENLGFGNGQNLGVMGGTPISKYKDLLEKEDIEEDDITDNEEGVSEGNNEESELDLNLTDQPGSDNEDRWMESISESKLIKRLSRKLHEADWIQKANKAIEKDGTEGEFHDWCVSEGFKDGCSKGCIDKGLKGTKKRKRQALFAKNTCK